VTLESAPSEGAALSENAGQGLSSSSRLPLNRPWGDVLVVLLLLVFSFAVRQWHLGLPETRYFDETYYSKAGEELLAGRADSNTVHPPLAKLIIATVGHFYSAIGEPLQRAGWVGGVTSWAKWRAGSLLFAMLTVPLTWSLALRMFSSRWCAATAAFLLSIDFLHLVQSRITMLDMYLAFFILFGAWSAWRFIEARRDLDGWAFVTVLSFSIGFACKWNSLFAGLGATAAMLLLKRYPDGWRGAFRWFWRIGLLYLVLVPLLYLAAFIPFLWQHKWDVRASFTDAVKNHKVMINFRYSKEFTHRYMSNFWSWPTMLRPVWYHYEEHKDPEGSLVPPSADSPAARLIWRGREPNEYITGILAMGSPFVWWTFLVFLLLTCVQSVALPLFEIALAAVRAARAAARVNEEPPSEAVSEGAQPASAEHSPEAAAEAPECAISTDSPVDALPCASPVVAPPPRPSILGEAWAAGLRCLDGWRFGAERPWLFLLLMYVPQVLLWSVNRGFFFYMLPCVPFMCIFIAGILREWLDLPFGRVCAGAYLGVATLFFVAYYPLLVGWSIPKPVYEVLVFTPRWI